MDMVENDNFVIYQKLVRDRIPQIIEGHGKKPYYRKIDGEELYRAIADKILEEAFELYGELTRKKREDVLKEAADLFEIIFAAVKTFGFELDDVLEKMRERAEERGAFLNGYLLEQVGGEESCDTDIRTNPSIVFGPSIGNGILHVIRGELKRAREVWVASAFYSPGAMNLLISEFSEFVKRGGRIRVLLSTMGNFVKPEYFMHIGENIPDVFVKVYHPPAIPFDKDPPNFHVKTWLFHHNSRKGSIITGSSNFTEAGLSRNVEWNYFSPLEVNIPFSFESTPFLSAKKEYEKIWDKESVPVCERFMEGYRKRYKKPTSIAEVDLYGPPKPDQKIEPNYAQREALENLADLRKEGVRKAAVIAATGVGKTYLAAFDYKQSGCESLLFIAHRETILSKARETYRNVLGDNSFGYLQGMGIAVPEESKAVFAMIQTLSRENNLRALSRKNFSYVVIDEFHHVEAASYKKVLDELSSSFLLGLTATPERMDGLDVLACCDYNVAYEIRILEAIEKQMLTPFQYFAIYDEVNYEQITWKSSKYDEYELSEALKSDTRTEIIAKNLRKYLPSNGKIKAIAFCSSVSHAKFTAQKLSSENGLSAIAILGESSAEERHTAIRRLEEEGDPLNIICSVDVFNEGIDIPQLTHVLFLRPTQSFTIFIQQLGRGLRKAKNKDYLVVLDFVGNFRKAHVAPLALSGYASTDDFKLSAKVDIRKLLSTRLPAGCYVGADLEVQRIWTDQIRALVDSSITTEERLKRIYKDIKNDLGKEDSLELMDMLYNAYGIDPYVYLRPPFANWLRAKKFCEDGELSEYEMKILDTKAEYFLQYIESGLNPVKSYKMVVIISLLQLKGTKWKVDDIATLFKQYYLANRNHLFDYEALANSSDPGSYPLRNVVGHLKRMPLQRLSNMETDCFILDGANNVFMIKKDYGKYWEDPSFKSIVRDRAEFGLLRYFMRAKIQQTIYYHPEILETGFEISRRFVDAIFEEENLHPGEKRKVNLKIGAKKYRSTIEALIRNNKYKIIYGEESELLESLKTLLNPLPEEGAKAFKVIAEKKYIKIEKK